MEKYLLKETPSKEERETITNYDELTDSLSFYTNVRRHITKLVKIFGEDGFDKVGVDEEGRILEIHINNVDERHMLIRDIPKERKMSEEEKQAVAERLRKARESK